MADDGFNGSTLDFASVTLGPLRSFGFRESGARVRVSGAGSTNHEYEAGIPDPELVVNFVGGLPATSADIGSSGALVVAWNDGSTDGTLANAVIVDRGTDGSMDGETLSSITLVPTPAA